MNEPEPNVGDAPGWYPHHGGYRFFDGVSWTEGYAFDSPMLNELKRIRRGVEILVIFLVVLPLALAVFVGVLALIGLYAL